MLTDLERLTSVARETFTLKIARCTRDRYVLGATLTSSGSAPDLSIQVLSFEELVVAQELVREWLADFLFNPQHIALQEWSRLWRERTFPVT